MSKWEYICKISACGDRYGYDGGIHDLLEWCQKSCTIDVTEAEARLFYELINIMGGTDGNGKKNCTGK